MEEDLTKLLLLEKFSLRDRSVSLIIEINQVLYLGSICRRHFYFSLAISVFTRLK